MTDVIAATPLYTLTWRPQLSDVRIRFRVDTPTVVKRQFLVDMIHSCRDEIGRLEERDDEGDSVGYSRSEWINPSISPRIYGDATVTSNVPSSG